MNARQFRRWLVALMGEQVEVAKIRFSTSSGDMEVLFEDGYSTTLSLPPDPEQPSVLTEDVDLDYNDTDPGSALSALLSDEADEIAYGPPHEGGELDETDYEDVIEYIDEGEEGGEA